MTPEQQIRLALDLGLQVWRTTKSSQRFHEAFAALDRLVAERDEARQDAEDSARLAYEANEHEKVLEGREAALRDALLTVRAECDLPDHIAEIVGEALGGGS